MFYLGMSSKGFEEISGYIETPSDIDITKKPLKSEPIKKNRVDINVLKSKLQETENKEFKKNLVILSFLVVLLGALGIYLSL